MSTSPTLTGKPPIIIAHRGASGILPEHTMMSYAAAIEMGANYIEPDLVITKDGHLVARHDRYLSGSTNVSDKPEFVSRKRTDPNHKGEDWFIEDFTLAEIKSLRARQPRAGRPTEFNDLYEIPTFDDIMKLAKSANVGIYPETKQPSAFTKVGLRHDEGLLGTLAKYGYDSQAAPVFIQSFEMGNLERLKTKTDIRLIFLTETRLDFVKIAKTVDGVGPYKKLLLDKNRKDTGFVTAAHDAGLAVHPWTLRDDDIGPLFPDIDTELQAYYALGVDGVFSDFPDTALRVRDRLQDKK